MTADLWALVAAMLLAVVQLTLSSVLTLRQLGGTWVAGARDEPREVTGISGRFVRAYRNLLENFHSSLPHCSWCMQLMPLGHCRQLALGCSSSPGCFMFPPTPSAP